MTVEEDVLGNIAKALSELSLEETLRLVKEAVSKGIPPTRIVLGGLSPGMKDVGKRYEERTYFLSELLFSAYIMNQCMEILKPLMGKDVQASATGKVVIGTVEGDLHDIGKNIFIALLEAAGFEVYDLGVDVPASRFVEKVKEVKPDILGLSALLSSTAPNFKLVIDALRGAGLRGSVYVMIGGPQGSEGFAGEVGADIYCKDAIEGVERAQRYMEELRGQ